MVLDSVRKYILTTPIGSLFGCIGGRERGGTHYMYSKLIGNGMHMKLNHTTVSTIHDC